jgi:hypothetical protein
MTLQANKERFEEAVEMRDRVGALATTLDRRDRIDGLRQSGRLSLLVDGTWVAEFRDGELRGAHPVGRQPLESPQPKKQSPEKTSLQRAGRRVSLRGLVSPAG